MTVKAYDLQTCSWSTLKTYGKPPVFYQYLSYFIYVHVHIYYMYAYVCLYSLRQLESLSPCT